MQVFAEGAAAAHTKAAVAADATVMLSSRRAAAGTLGPPIHTEPCSASAPPWLGTINAKPSALLLAQGGAWGRLRASPATPAGQPQVAAGTLQATAGLEQHCW